MHISTYINVQMANVVVTCLLVVLKLLIVLCDGNCDADSNYDAVD